MLINRNNYEEFFMLYVDGELSAGHRSAVEKFVAANPDLLKELDLLKGTVLVPDSEIIFEHKEELFREEKRKVIGLIWWRVAAAVILLFGAGLWGWNYVNEKEIPGSPIATISPKQSAEVPLAAAADVKKTPAIAFTPSAPAIVMTPQPHVKPGTSSRRVIQKVPANKKTQIDLSPNLSATLTDPLIPDVAINVVPQKLNEENPEEKQTAPLNKKENNVASYEYVDASENDDIYVANTAFSKRNKFRGVIRKATRILDRVTSIQ